MYFSTSIHVVYFAFLWFYCSVLFDSGSLDGSGSLDVKSETVFVYLN